MKICFSIKQEEAYSELKEIKARVLQGSVLGQFYTYWINSEFGNNTVVTFADVIAILALGVSNEEATEILQTSINQVQS